MTRELRARLNALYRPLYEEGKRLLALVRELGFAARLTYCNLHEVEVAGAYETEYFPLPEIEIAFDGAVADLGVSLDGSAWLEVTLPRVRALTIDYPALAQRHRVEVYGVENYLSDFYHEGMDAADVSKRIFASQESHIRICFRFAKADAEGILGALAYAREHD